MIYFVNCGTIDSYDGIVDGKRRTPEGCDEGSVGHMPLTWFAKLATSQWRFDGWP
jgi:hypothetical protein